MATFRSREAIEKEQIDEEWGSLRWLASGEIGNAAGVTIGRMVMKPGGENATHAHANCEEMILLLRGRVEHMIGGKRIDQAPGDMIGVPAGVPHRTANVGDEEAELLITFSSGAREFHRESP